MELDEVVITVIFSLIVENKRVFLTFIDKAITRLMSIGGRIPILSEIFLEIP